MFEYDLNLSSSHAIFRSVTRGQEPLRILDTFVAIKASEQIPSIIINQGPANTGQLRL